MGRSAHGKGTGKGDRGAKRSDVFIEDNSGLRQRRGETTRYVPKRHPQAIAIAKLAKQHTPRKIAKTLGVPLDEVRDVLADVGRGSA